MKTAGELEATSGNQVFGLRLAKPINQKLFKLNWLQGIVEALGRPRTGGRSGGYPAIVRFLETRLAAVRVAALVTVKGFSGRSSYGFGCPAIGCVFHAEAAFAFNPNAPPKRRGR
jgi:hypothetical protein